MSSPDIQVSLSVTFSSSSLLHVCVCLYHISLKICIIIIHFCDYKLSYYKWLFYDNFQVNGRRGYFPRSFVREFHVLIPNPEKVVPTEVNCILFLLIFKMICLTNCEKDFCANINLIVYMYQISCRKTFLFTPWIGNTFCSDSFHTYLYHVPIAYWSKKTNLRYQTISEGLCILFILAFLIETTI